MPSFSTAFVPHSGGEDGRVHEALLRIDRLEVLDDLEPPASHLGDVHDPLRAEALWLVRERACTGE
jgi:hypothetical protein